MAEPRPHKPVRGGSNPPADTKPCILVKRALLYGVSAGFNSSAGYVWYLNPVPITDKDQYNQYMSAYMLTRYHRRKAAAREQLGGACAVCGATDELEVDHIDWRTKSFPVSKMWSVSEARFQAELAKCQLLCRVHHKDKTRKDLREIWQERRRPSLAQRHCIRLLIEGFSVRIRGGGHG